MSRVGLRQRLPSDRRAALDRDGGHAALLTSKSIETICDGRQPKPPRPSPSRSRPPGPAPPLRAGQGLVGDGEGGDLQPLVAGLAEPYREAIVLAEYEGLARAEAARRAGVSVPGMKSRVQRTRRHPGDLLGACCRVELDARKAVRSVESRGPAPVEAQPQPPLGGQSLGGQHACRLACRSLSALPILAGSAR
ncbi:sigma factor-like helix-turn-helix DNA-binding protein [Nonomuraea dietziae]|uniref:sigma factor-like helix-turn-helix DNA-binding protein n=1 Tax=Nonomuraea dietziae TaxID=65515 RepID=UPI0033FF3DCF